MRYPYFKQERIYWCGPACAQMVLAQHGIKLSQAEIAKRLKANRLLGVLRVMLVRELRKHGIVVHVVAKGTLEDLAALTPAIVNYNDIDDDDHFAVVTKLTKTHVVMQDPWHGPDYKLTTHEFIDRWRNRKRRKKYTGWLAAVRWKKRT